jgi:hypothetical protein
VSLESEHDALRRDLEAMSHTELVNWALTVSWGHDQLTRLLEACPECPEHGQCIPHAFEWIKVQRGQTVELTPIPAEYQLPPVDVALVADYRRARGCLAVDGEPLDVNTRLVQDGD